MDHHRKNPRNQGFELVDLAAFVAVLVVLGGLWFAITPSRGRGHHTGKAHNSTNLASIAKRMTIIGTESTNAAWPGKGGDTTRDKFYDMFVSAPGKLRVSSPPINADLWTMTSRLAINPNDLGIAEAWPERGPIQLATSLTSADGHISYAITKNPDYWQNTLHAQAPLICDRKVGNGGVWNKRHWEGSLVWGDAHANYVTTTRHTVLIGNTTKNADLFDPADVVAMTYD